MTFGRNPYENQPSDRWYDDRYAEYDEYVAECEAEDVTPLDFDAWLDDWEDDARREAEEARAEAILDARDYDY